MSANMLLTDPTKVKIYTPNIEDADKSCFLTIGFYQFPEFTLALKFPNNEKIKKFLEMKKITVTEPIVNYIEQVETENNKEVILRIKNSVVTQEEYIDDETSLTNTREVITEEIEDIKITDNLLNSYPLISDTDNFLSDEEFRELSIINYIGSLSETGHYIHIVRNKNNDEIKILALNEYFSAKSYYLAKELNISFDYSDDELYFRNVIDLNRDIERSVKISLFSEELTNALEENSKEDVESAIDKYKSLSDELLKDNDPITVMINLAREYSETARKFNEKYKDFIEVEIPEDATTMEEIEEKYPEIYEKLKVDNGQFIKDEEELQLMQTKYKTIEKINKQLEVETRHQYTFDNLYKKNDLYLENAERNGNEKSASVYREIKKCYDESCNLIPLKHIELFSKKNPGKFSQTLVDNYDGVIKRVRTKLSQEVFFSFIDPIIIPTRVKSIMEANPEIFESFDKEVYPSMIYYLFCKTIDINKSNYVKKAGLFILKFTQHIYHFFDPHYLFSRRDEFLKNLAYLMSLIKNDIESPVGIKKYNNKFNTVGISFIKEKNIETENFFKEKLKEIKRNKALEKLTMQSMSEEEDNPIFPDPEETE